LLYSKPETPANATNATNVTDVTHETPFDTLRYFLRYASLLVC